MFQSDILFTGFYGHKNTGDDAFIEVSQWGAKTYWGANGVRYLAKKENLPETKSGSVYGFPVALPKTYRLQGEFLLRNSSCLISAGGSTIHSKMDPKNIKQKAVELKKQGSKIKIGGIGVSIGPFKSSDDERAVYEYLHYLDFLAVRDQASFDIVSQLDLPYQPVNAFDLAALMPNIYPESKKEKNKKIIGISVCPYESIVAPTHINNEIKRNEMMCELLKHLDTQEDIHFKFLIINGNDQIGDERLTLETISKVQPKSFEVVPYQRKTQRMWEAIQSCDFVISTRLHAAIFACFAEIPFMLNEYHRKCGDFLETVEYQPTYRLFDSEFCVKSKAKQIIEIISKNDYCSPGKRVEAIQKAELNFAGVSI
ncbi:polysaccharide pyruvyl transferase family protein [Alkanindiges illinoisensis]|uniref:polysaccharide pyruvyl transferase family protein n=1 Tax=Alkanindiges illinoisensis TaxID=197183 RepID=UPI00047D0485|nr:polysaccharide pyruvyl transferase family protein [Alkanindiges illinoisensis]